MARWVKATKICERCGKAFHPIAGRTATQRYCSKACSDQPRMALKAMTPEQVAWLAGIFDGEGNLQVEAKLGQRANGVRIQVTNTSLPMVERIKEWTGVGYICKTEYDNPNWQTRYVWINSGANARHLLRQMLPWLIVKREKALIALSKE